MTLKQTIKLKNTANKQKEQYGSIADYINKSQKLTEICRIIANVK